MDSVPGTLAALRAEIATSVRMIRKKGGMSQAALGAIFGWSQSTIAEIESGRRRLELAEFIVMAQVLKLSACEELSSLLARLYGDDFKTHS